MDATGKVCCIVCRPTLCQLPALYVPNMHQELDNVQRNMRGLNQSVVTNLLGNRCEIKKNVRTYLRPNTTHLVGTFFYVHFNSNSTVQKYDILTPDIFLCYSHDTI